MLRVPCLLLLAAVLALTGCAHGGRASNLEVRTTGDAQAYGVYSTHPFGAGHR